MKSYKRSEVISLLNNNGFFSKRKSKHEIYEHVTGIVLPLPYHYIIAPGIMRTILKQIANAKAKLNNTDSSTNT